MRDDNVLYASTKREEKQLKEDEGIALALLLQIVLNGIARAASKGRRTGGGGQEGPFGFAETALRLQTKSS